MELFFFPFLFPSYCHSVDHRVVSIVSDGSYQSSFVFFYVVLESLYRCVKSSSSLFLDTYSLSTPSLPYAWSLVSLFLVHFFSGPLHKGFRISNEGYSRGIYSFYKVVIEIITHSNDRASVWPVS